MRINRVSLSLEKREREHNSCFLLEPLVTLDTADTNMLLDYHWGLERLICCKWGFAPLERMGPEELLKSSLSLEVQVTSVVRTAYCYSLMYKLCPFLYRDNLAILTHMLATSYLNYSNVLYIALPLYSVQVASARLLSDTSYARIMTLLK